METLVVIFSEFMPLLDMGGKSPNCNHRSFSSALRFVGRCIRSVIWTSENNIAVAVFIYKSNLVFLGGKINRKYEYVKANIRQLKYLLHEFQNKSNEFISRRAI